MQQLFPGRLQQLCSHSVVHWIGSSRCRPLIPEQCIYLVSSWNLLGLPFTSPDHGILSLNIQDMDWYFHAITIPIAAFSFGYKDEDAKQRTLGWSYDLTAGIHWCHTFDTFLTNLRSGSSVVVRLIPPGFAGVLILESRE